MHNVMTDFVRNKHGTFAGRAGVLATNCTALFVKKCACPFQKWIIWLQPMKFEFSRLYGSLNQLHRVERIGATRYKRDMELGRCFSH